MTSSPLTVDSHLITRIRPRPRRSALSVNFAGHRRALQVVLGLIWLLDAALQFQPYMFTRAFASQVIAVNAAGNPAVIAGPITWSAGLMARHIVLCNAAFASIQLLLGAGLLWRPTARVALAASIPWALGVWWIGEGFGGLFAGSADPLTGAPGAAVLYMFLALLVWPSETPRSGRSVAVTGWLGPVAPRVGWAALWGSFGYLVLRPANHIGTEVAVVFAVACAVAAGTVAVGRFTRTGVLIAVVLGAVIWAAEDFGGIFTGQGTDPNSGLLLIVIAAAFWPVAVPASRAGSRRYGRAPVRTVTPADRFL